MNECFVNALFMYFSYNLYCLCFWGFTYIYVQSLSDEYSIMMCEHDGGV